MKFISLNMIDDPGESGPSKTWAEAINVDTIASIACNDDKITEIILLNGRILYAQIDYDLMCTYLDADDYYNDDDDDDDDNDDPTPMTSEELQAMYEN